MRLGPLEVAVAYVLAGILTVVDADARVIAVGGTRLHLIDGVPIPGPAGSSVTVMVEERDGVPWAISVVASPGAVFGTVRKPPAPAGSAREPRPDTSAQGRQAAP